MESKNSGRWTRKDLERVEVVDTNCHRNRRRCCFVVLNYFDRFGHIDRSLRMLSHSYFWHSSFLPLAASVFVV